MEAEKQSPRRAETEISAATTQNDIHLNTTAASQTKSPTGIKPSPTWVRPMHRRVRTNSIDLDDYFKGPRNVEKHSKWPFFMRMHGSVLPKMILPLTFIGGWATCITLLSRNVTDLGVDSLLLTVLGFVVGLGLSFRSSTAYERFTEGRKYFSQLQMLIQNMSRVIWVSVKEGPVPKEGVTVEGPHGEIGKRHLLEKLTALNLLAGFAVALKHKLRFEPGIHHEDLVGLIAWLDTFARASASAIPATKPKTPWKATGEYLGVSFAESNPRKLVKEAEKTATLGNLPLEILKYLNAYVDNVLDEGRLPIPYQSAFVANIASLNEVMVGVERVLNTPMPLAYNIAISQITWVYVLLLPFQLYPKLGWITIPATVFAAYIILGLSAIGREIENPFGSDVNDLPLDDFCDEIIKDIDILTSAPPPTSNLFTECEDNMVLHPLSAHGVRDWQARSKYDIREALATKCNASLRTRKSTWAERQSEETDAEPHHGREVV